VGFESVKNVQSLPVLNFELELCKINYRVFVVRIFKLSMSMVLQAECEVKHEDKQQTINTDVVSSQKQVRNVSSDSRPRLPSKSGVHASKSSSCSTSQSGLKQPPNSAVVSSTALQELRADVAAKTTTRKSAVSAGKKSTVRYKPAHHSAPFKTTPLPPGQSKLPPVSRPGSRRAAAPSARASRLTEGRRIGHHGGQINIDSLASSQAVERRRIVCDEGRTSITSSASVAVNGLGRNSSGSIVSRDDISDIRTAELHRIDADGSTMNVARGLQAVLMSDSGNPNIDRIPSDNVASLAKHDSDTGQTVELQRPDDGRSRVAASTVIAAQSRSTFVTASDVSRKTEAVDQSSTVIQRDTSLSHSEQNVTENSTSSFILHKDGQVTCVMSAVAALPFFISNY